jgi:hypothetical protein
MAAYNAATHIDEAIASVLNQTHEDFELLVVDDGSSDSTPEIVRSYTDSRIRVVSRQHNVGVAAARNFGMQLAEADLIAFLDADDIAYPKRLEKQIAFMSEHSECGLLGCACDLIDESGAHQGSYQPPCETGMIRWNLLIRNVIVTSTAMLRRPVALAAGGYDERFQVCEDYGLWARMAPITEVAQIPEILVAHRMNPHGLSTTRQVEMQSAASVVAQKALSASVGHPVALQAVRCLAGTRPANQSPKAMCCEAAGAMAEALERMVADDEATREIKPMLLRDWRRQVAKLLSVAPSALPCVLATSLRLSLRVAGWRGLLGAYAVWVLNSVAIAVRAVCLSMRRSPIGFDDGDGVTGFPLDGV